MAVRYHGVSNLSICIFAIFFTYFFPGFSLRILNLVVFFKMSQWIFTGLGFLPLHPRLPIPLV